MAPDRDRAYIESILHAAKRAHVHLHDMRREDFDRNPTVQDAIFWVLTTVGEAAAKLSPAFRADHSSINWSAIARLRNELIHRYWNINQNVVWNSATKSLPDLVIKLEQIKWPKKPAAVLDREVAALLSRPSRRSRR